MLSRIFWVGIAGVALVTGMIIQDGGSIFSWGDQSSMAARTERTIDRSIDRAVDRNIDRMEVVGSDGREIELSREAKRALGQAIGDLVEAETALAMLKVRNADASEIAAATERRDEARAAVDRLKKQIDASKQAAGDESASAQIERQVRDDVREDVRAAVRDAASN